MSALWLLTLIPIWVLCALWTVWFAARFAGSDSAVFDFFIWPVALLGTLCILAHEKTRIGVISELSERGLRARALARARERSK